MHDGYNGTMRRLSMLLAALFAAAACETRDEPYRRAALNIEPSMTEQQAIAAAGAPSLTENATVICRREGGARELLYHSTLVYFGGLKKDVHATVLVCLDSKGIVLSKHEIDF
jgi:hypothetical protein